MTLLSESPAVMAADAPTVLTVDGLHVSYGSTAALHGVSLDVRAGETVALIGANGAGKSTTLRAISGILKARSGSITWDGKPIANLPPDRIVAAGIAHCPEERHVWPHMTVEENIMLGAYLCRSRSEVQRRAGMAFHRFPRLRERAKQLAGTLSGGEQQMLAIARALMSEPRLLMLDEPSLGLSPKMADEVFDVVRSINAHGVTVLLVEQNIHNALSVASRAYVVKTGRIAASRPAAELRDDPDLLRAYLGG
ncbi:ABC transporter ATP-binding protein [Azospirillum rugosum]|uniref:Branched-chain amino acid transport system ATP-binding protein n=1 Tax=Azospirillum rugosum TaxID=416170 RepID=A0ABS4SVU8_9PROT|nr:ABC transporter ATP-binding protein [Azospirillum rugosum]MBP2296183.1 branched-chain amino acid transport system ATP-binding protein [Azospirillum rugosum]MDQ0527132.1 branched-chain amino acid transport system ATP-binding protein [Azospirillum rugosum]